MRSQIKLIAPATMRGQTRGAFAVAVVPRALSHQPLHHSVRPLASAAVVAAAPACSIRRACSARPLNAGIASRNAPSRTLATGDEANDASQRLRVRSLPPVGAAPCFAAASAGASTAAEPAASSDASAAAASTAANQTPLTPAETASLTDAIHDQLEGVVALPAHLQTAPHWIVQHSIDVIHWVHDVTGSPWWMTLVLCAVGARVMLLPVQLFATRVTAGIMTLSGHFALFDTVLRRGPGTPRQKLAQSARFKMQMYTKFHCNPLYLIPGAALQVSLFILMGLSLRRMLLTTPGLATGGLAWFVDLGVPDPYYILPAITWSLGYGVSWYVARDREQQEAAVREESGVERIRADLLRAVKVKGGGSKLLSLPASGERAKDHEPTHLELLSHYARGVQVLLICVYPQVSAGLLVFWITSLTWQALYTRLMATEVMRARMGFTGVIPPPVAFVKNVEKQAAIQQAVRDNEARRARRKAMRGGAVVDDADDDDDTLQDWEYEQVEQAVKSPDGTPAVLTTKQRKQAKAAEIKKIQQASMQPLPKQ